MNPFSKLASGIPLDEAAAYFIKLKTASESYEAPDETGQLEGQFAAPVEQVLAHMAEMVQAELKAHYAYTVYSQSMRDLARGNIAQEFLQHADHETEHAEFLLRRLAVLGGPTELPDIPAPPPATDPVEIVQTMIRMEQEGIANWRQLLALVGDENPTKFKIEEYLGEELEHLDELWQLVPHTERQAILEEQPGQAAPAAPAKPEAPAAAPPAPAEQQKTASAPRVEQHHPETLRYHGSVMKTALAALKPTVFVPTIDEEGNIKQAAARFTKAAAEFNEALPYAVGHGVLNPLPGSGYGALAGGLMTEGGEKHPALRGAGLGALAGGTTWGMKALATGERPRDAALLALLGASGGALGGAHAGHAIAKSRSKSKKANAGGMAPPPPLQGAATGAVMPTPPPTPPLQGAAAGQHKMAERMKRAFEELPPAEPVPGGKEEQDLQAYLEEEAAHRSAETEAEGGYYKQRFQEAMQQLQAAQEETAQLQEQLQGLEAQVGQNGEVQQQALSQAQQIQDAAMQQSTAANAAAAAAMQKSLAAQKEMLEQQRLAIQMRDAIQAMKTQVLSLVQTELPPATTMEAGVSATADQAHADMQAAQAAAAGMDPAQAAQQPPPGAPAPGGDPAAAGAPADPAAAGGAPAPGAEAAPAGPPGQKIPEEQKKAPSGGEDKPEPKKEEGGEKEASDRFVGALVGAAAGGLGTAVESQMSNDPLRAKVKKLQQLESSGEGGFGNAMNLAQAKMRLALGEVAEKHPVGASLAGAAAGAMTGAGAAPHARQIVDAIRR